MSEAAAIFALTAPTGTAKPASHRANADGEGESFETVLKQTETNSSGTGEMPAPLTQPMTQLRQLLAEAQSLLLNAEANIELANAALSAAPEAIAAVSAVAPVLSDHLALQFANFVQAQTSAATETPNAYAFGKSPEHQTLVETLKSLAKTSGTHTDQTIEASRAIPANDQPAAQSIILPPELLRVPSARSNAPVQTAQAQTKTNAAQTNLADGPASISNSLDGQPPSETLTASAVNALASTQSSNGQSVDQQAASKSDGTNINSVATPQPGQVTTSFVDAQKTVALETRAAQASVPLDALAVHIARKFDAGNSEFEISLHPADLGKLDITMTVAEDGRVQAVLRAERAETLDLLQRDARALEQQLRQAGLDVGSNALSFQLSQGQSHQNKAGQGSSRFEQLAQTDQPVDEPATHYVTVNKSDGLDIRI